MRIPTEIMRELVERWKNRLNLHAWEIRWEWVNKKNDEDGHCKCFYGQDIADIDIDTCIEADFKRVRHVIIHELMHVRIERIVTGVEKLETAGVFAGATWNVFELMWKEQVEKDVDALAAIFSEASGEWADEDLKAKFEKAQKTTLKGGKSSWSA